MQGVGRLADGTAVWFGTSAGMAPGDGSMAATVVVPADAVVPLPEGVPMHVIAALGLSAVAAHAALTRAAGLAADRAGGLAAGGVDGGTAGEQVVVLGAGGVVGQAAVQLALLGGARRVIAVARSAAARERALRLGAASAVQLFAEDTVDTLAARLRGAADGPIDLVIDPVFGIPAAAALRALRPGGRLVNLGSAAGATAPIESTVLRSGSLQVIGYTNNSLSLAERNAALDVIAGHVAAGRLTVDHETVPLAEVAGAWSRQAAGTATGRLVLTF